MVKELKGIVVFDGIVIVKVYLFVEFDFFYEKIEVMDVESEVKCFESVLEVFRIEFLMICEKVVKDLGEDKV